MIELDDTPTNRANETIQGGNFFDDESRSGFGVDEESFGASPRVSVPDVAAASAIASTVPSVNAELPKETITTVAESTPVRQSVPTSEAQASANAIFPSKLSVEEASGEILAKIFSKEAPKIADTIADSPSAGTAETPTPQPSELLREAFTKAAPPTSTSFRTLSSIAESSPALSVSEKKQIADMVARGEAVSAASIAENAGIKPRLGKTTSRTVSSAGTELGEKPVITIPSEADLAREQQQRLKNRADFRAAEECKKHSSSLAIAALVISILLGAATIAGFFAWRNPQLRFAAGEAWSKLTGKAAAPVTTIGQPTNGNNSVENVVLPSTSAASSSGASLDLTQSVAAKTGTVQPVAAQNSIQNASVSTASTPQTSGNTPSTSDANAKVLVEAPVQPSAQKKSSVAQNSVQSPSANSPKASSTQTLAQSSIPSKNASATLAANSAKTSPPSKQVEGLPVNSSATKPAPAPVSTPPKAAETKPVNKPTTPVQQAPATASEQAQKKTTLTKPALEKFSSPAVGNGVFAIQVYATPSQEDAEEWIERLRRRGLLNPMMSSQVVRGQVLYRVRFGLYNSLREAEREADRFGFAGAWVVRLR
jgi:hypothetical protein